MRKAWKKIIDGLANPANLQSCDDEGLQDGRQEGGRLGIGAIAGEVALDFGGPCTVISFDPQEAVDFASAMIMVARRLAAEQGIVLRFLV